MFKSFNIRKLSPVLVYASIVLMILAFFLVEYVNYITTAESLEAMFGDGVWIMATALAMVAIDVSALVLVFIPEGSGKASDTIMKMLLGVWALVSGLDMLLSWYFASVRMESTSVVAPDAMIGFVWIMPVAVAFMLWGIQFGMIYTLGQLIGGGSRKSLGLSRVAERS